MNAGSGNGRRAQADATSNDGRDVTSEACSRKTDVGGQRQEGMV